jgi:hypothetical protein
MIFGREVDDLEARGIPIKIGFAEPHRIAMRAGLVVLEHRWVTLLELFGDALAHYADAIDRVDQGLRPAFEWVPYQRLEHGRPNPSNEK